MRRLVGCGGGRLCLCSFSVKLKMNWILYGYCAYALTIACFENKVVDEIGKVDAEFENSVSEGVFGDYNADTCVDRKGKALV